MQDGQEQPEPNDPSLQYSSPWTSPEDDDGIYSEQRSEDVRSDRLVKPTTTREAPKNQKKERPKSTDERKPSIEQNKSEDRLSYYKDWYNRGGKEQQQQNYQVKKQLQEQGKTYFESVKEKKDQKISKYKIKHKKWKDRYKGLRLEQKTQSNPPINPYATDGFGRKILNPIYH